MTGPGVAADVGRHRVQGEATFSTVWKPRPTRAP